MEQQKGMQMIQVTITTASGRSLTHECKDAEEAKKLIETFEARGFSAAQRRIAADFAETCEYCDTPLNSPSFAYHICTGRKAALP